MTRIFQQIVVLLRNYRDDQRGAVAIYMAVIFVVLIGFAALAIDIGNALATQRQMQSAADAAALGGAAAIAADSSGGSHPANYSNEVYSIARTSFLTSPEKASFVVTPSIPSPPTKVKVTITLPRSLTLVSAFRSLIGDGASGPFTLAATATAIVNRNNNYCFLALNRTAPAAVYVGGSAIVSSTNGCGVADNSSASNALQTKGSAASITVPISVVGGWSFTGNPPAPSLKYAWPVQDPYANTVKPALQALSGSIFNYKIDVSGGKTLNLSPNTTYYVSSLKGNGTVTGTNVTLIFSSTFNFPNSLPTIDIQPPTSGTYAGISIASLSSDALNFNGGTNFSGAIYVPNSALTMTGSSGSNCMQAIADTIKFNGNADVHDDCPALTTKILGSTIQLIN